MLLNPAPVAPVPQALLDKITYLTPNEHEAATLFAGKGKADILDQNQGKVIMTLGSKGVAYAEKGQVITVPGFKVKPVDTTGAGDTFNGAFAVARAMANPCRKASALPMLPQLFRCKSWEHRAVCLIYMK